jgi:uncharacterized protein YecE (DUF72 family)
LTHAKKLYAPEEWIQRIASGLHELGDKRGVFLVQLGPNQIREWSGQTREVYAYFNNDGDANAVRDAEALRQLLNH